MKLMLLDRRFEELKDKGLFSIVELDVGGYGISWNDSIDLSEYELWQNRKTLN